MLLNRKTEGRAERANPLSRAMGALGAKTVDRRSFLKGSGITAGAAAFASQLPLGMVGDASAAPAAGGKVEVTGTVCTHCRWAAPSTRSSRTAWGGQEPVFDSPINLGAHCARARACARTA